MFKNVIVRKPSKKICDGITSNPQFGKPIYEKALKQHQSYIDTLKKCGVNVTILEELDNFPDSCFVEDVAVLTKKCAIITNPGASSRNEEKNYIIDTIKKFFSEDKIEYIKSPGTLEGGDVMMVGITNPGASSRNEEKNYIIDTIKKFFSEDKIEYIKSPGTLEGGDVMMVGDHFYIGKSERTNEEGIKQFIEILEKYGLSGSEVKLEEVLHLKTGVNYLENNTLLVSGEFINKEEFKNFNKIIVPEDEAYASNCIWVNDTVIVPEGGYPKIKKLIEDAGYKTICTDTSEFKKIDGGLSCLSLRF